MTMSRPDSELVRAARSGDREAMNELVRRHHGVAFRTALAILGDEDDASDAVQDGFIRAFGALDGFRREATFRTWLLTIVANQARGALRRAKRRRESPIVDDERFAIDSEDQLDGLERAARVARVREHLERLPEKQRMSVSLRLFDGLSFREVGELIGSSEGAARVNFHHGIRRLREALEEER